MGRLTPPQLLIISFLCVIVIGAILLSLPLATEGLGRLTPVDSLFTATSATCVTGLIVQDTGSHFTPFGRWVIFALFQAGGLGIMTFSTLFAVLLGRTLGFHQTDVIRSTLNGHNILGLKKLITYILGITFVIELIGAGCLFLRWRATTAWGIIETIQNAAFHSVSGFCNAGFALFRNNMMDFAADPYINLTMMLLIFFGGIGFIVIMDLLGLFVKRGMERRLSLQAKVALSVSGILILAGAIGIFVFEQGNVMKSMPLQEKVWTSFFQSVSARTAGFNTLNIGNMTISSILILIALMFIGASPGSTGGGIKTCTFAVLWATVAGFFKNRDRVRIMHRSIPRDIIRESIVIFFLAVGWVFFFTILLTFFEGRQIISSADLTRSLFEVVSAFGTVGLSTGITGGLSDAGKLCLVATMFAGRVGPLTLALGVAFKERKEKIKYPDENIMVG